MKMKNTILLLLLLVSVQACKKSEFLNKKPSTDLVVPETLTDMIALLDNNNVINTYSPGLPIMSGEEYYYQTQADWEAISSATGRSAFIWAKDIYAGEVSISDWNGPYKAVFYANAVLDQWKKLSADQQNSREGQYVKGWALFTRAYNFYELLQTFSLAYDAGTANSDLGIPLRLSSDINDRQSRASVKESYERVLTDLDAAEALLSVTIFSEKNRYRPSGAAVNALQARIYLSMLNYIKAENASKKSLISYNKLVNYNLFNQNVDAPFDDFNPEVLFKKISVNSEFGRVLSTGFYAFSLIAPQLIDLYDENDLRKTIFFTNKSGSFFMKSGYSGTSFWPFTGLAVDEVYLIQAECLARKNDLEGALKVLNQLLEKRYVTGKYKPFQSDSKQEVLNKILLERRKELVWRGLRWSDIKRLNKEGANITLTHNLGGQIYTLAPNDPRYALPIPDDEITLSGIQQNPR
jgi:hypothetical protein